MANQVLNSYELSTGGPPPASPYIQNVKAAFAPRIMASMAVVIAIITLIALGFRMIDGDLSQAGYNNYLTIAKYCGYVAAGATGASLIRDLYATARTWFATHHKGNTCSIAKDEIGMSLFALPFGVLALSNIVR